MRAYRSLIYAILTANLIAAGSTAAGFLLGLTPSATALGAEARGEQHPSPTFLTIDVPSALGTLAADISPTGDIVGRYCLEPSCLQDVTGNWHGFLLSGGEFTSIDFPGAFHTNATGINAHGDIVGRYRDVVGGPFHGFLLSGGKFTSIDVPGAFSTRAYGITPGGEIIVGDYCTDPGCIRPAAGHWHGFVLSEGEFSTFDFPGAVITQVWRINPQEEIVGRYKGTDGVFHVFLLSDGGFTSIDFPGAVNTGGDAGGINPRGDIVSSYCDTPGACPPALATAFFSERGNSVRLISLALLPPWHTGSILGATSSGFTSIRAVTSTATGGGGRKRAR
jgi:uncharacterized membrane protein